MVLQAGLGDLRAAFGNFTHRLRAGPYDGSLPIETEVGPVEMRSELWPAESALLRSDGTETSQRPPEQFDPPSHSVELCHASLTKAGRGPDAALSDR